MLDDQSYPENADRARIEGFSVRCHNMVWTDLNQGG